MTVNVRYVAGYVTISQQLLDQAIEDEEAIKRWEERMDSDPEYAAEWHRQQDERESEEWD